MNVVLTISGFLIAFLVNLLFPQVAENVRIKEYVFGGFRVDDNLAYRLVLLTIIAYYAVYTVVLFVRKASADKVAKFFAGAKFRFAVGLALAAWDILGTKLLFLPQPFFPGPAIIMDAFIGDTKFIWQNTLYSLRLFVAGFSVGVVTGVLTGVLIGWYPKARYWILPVLNICGGMDAFCLDAFPDFVCGGDFLDCDLLLVPGGDHDGRRGAGYAEVVV